MLNAGKAVKVSIYLERRIDAPWGCHLFEHPRLPVLSGSLRRNGSERDSWVWRGPPYA